MGKSSPPLEMDLRSKDGTSMIIILPRHEPLENLEHCDVSLAPELRIQYLATGSRVKSFMKMTWTCIDSNLNIALHTSAAQCHGI